jgi:hypothetical protein
MDILALAEENLPKKGKDFRHHVEPYGGPGR